MGLFLVFAFFFSGASVDLAMVKVYAPQPSASTAIWNLEAISGVKAYQRYISPTLSHAGKRCLYKPSCSAYAIFALQKYGLLKAVYKTWLRIKDCNWYTRYKNIRPVIDYP